MKTKQRLSGPVLAFGIVAILICALVGWFGIRRQRANPSAETTAQTAGVSTPLTDSATNETSSTEAPIVPRTFEGGIPPVIPISLASVLVEPESGVWAKDKPWIYIPHGSNTYCGVDFNIEGVIQLEGLGSIQGKRFYRKSVTVPLTVTNSNEVGLQVAELGTNVGCIHLLSATRYSGEAQVGAKVADVIWHYADGNVRRTPVQYAVHVRDWRRERFEQPANVSHPGAKVVWRSSERTDSDRNMRIYRFALANPEPARAVRSLEFVSAGANPSLFFIALSLDPLRLGERPDDSPDLEEVDPLPARTLEITVQDSTGQVIQGARVRAFYEQKMDGNTSRINKSLTTDVNGMVVFKFASADLEKIELSAWHDDADYGGRKMTWDTGTGDIIPASYTFKLGEGITIGGTVVDEADQPIAGVKLNFYRFSNSNEEATRKGDQPDYPNRTVTTDIAGVWQAKGLPPDMLDRIGFNIKHPDFVELSLHVGEGEGEQAKFRAGTHKIILKRGLIVRGKVVDGSDYPVKDAQVWAGKQYYSGTQDTKTDVKGEFSFRNLKEGDVQFSVLAKGLKPETKAIAVKAGMDEIVFKLVKGSIIRGVVRNESGEAVSGATLSLESRSLDGSQSFPFGMKSDNDGRFEWDGAPDEPQRFSIYKQGYESKRGQLLKVAEENVIVLRKGRKVEGWVVDAETEKPVTKFRVGVGRHQGDDRFYADYPGMKDYSNVNGTFTLDLNEEQNNGIKAEADDYAEKIEKLPAAEDGVVKIVIRLKPSAALRGVLVDAQGSPVSGGTVGLTTDNSMGGGGVMLRNGRLSSYSGGGKVVTTDASGNFKLPSPPETRGVVVGAAPAGFVSSPVEQVRSSGRLVLQGFGRIEGSIKIAGVPTAGMEFSYGLGNVGVSLQSDNRTTSDDQGKFSFDKIPAGEGSVVRLIKMNGNSWRHSHNTPVVVESGKTTQISFGEDGAVIKGQVRLGFTPPEGETLTYEGGLSTKMPQPDFTGMTQEEIQAYIKTPEFTDRMKRMKHFGVNISADGALSLDSIPPGEYTLNVSVNKPGAESWRNIPVGTGSTTLTVPESASPNAPIGIGDIILKPVPKQ